MDYHPCAMSTSCNSRILKDLTEAMVNSERQFSVLDMLSMKSSLVTSQCNAQVSLQS